MAYYNPLASKKENLNTKEMTDVPEFVKQFIMYLDIDKNNAPGTIFEYYVLIETFLRWLVYSQLPLEEQKKYELQDMQYFQVKPEDLAALSPNDIREYMHFCSEQLDNSVNSRISKLAAVRSLYKFLVTTAYPGDDGKPACTINPAELVPTPKKEKPLPKYLTLQEAKKLLESIEGRDKERDYCIILWFLNCGMRLTELCSINIYDFRDGVIRIRGKGRKERQLYLNYSCLVALEAYLRKRETYKNIIDEDALFVSAKTGTRLTPRRVEQIVEKHLKAAGLQGTECSPHKLRHTAATQLYQSGAGDILEISSLLGHESLDVTRIYVNQLTNTNDFVIRSPLNYTREDMRPNKVGNEKAEEPGIEEILGEDED